MTEMTDCTCHDNLCKNFGIGKACWNMVLDEQEGQTWDYTKLKNAFKEDFGCEKISQDQFFTFTSTNDIKDFMVVENANDNNNKDNDEDESKEKGGDEGSTEDEQEGQEARPEGEEEGEYQKQDDLDDLSAHLMKQKTSMKLQIEELRLQMKKKEEEFNKIENKIQEEYNKKQHLVEEMEKNFFWNGVEPSSHLGKHLTKNWKTSTKASEGLKETVLTGGGFKKVIEKIKLSLQKSFKLGVKDEHLMELEKKCLAFALEEQQKVKKKLGLGLKRSASSSSSSSSGSGGNKRRKT